MNVGINGRHLGSNKTGVGRYLLSLLQEWQREPRGHRFFVYVSTEQLTSEDEALFSPGSPITLRRVPRPFGTHSFHLWYNWSLPRAMVRDKVDWFFSPDYFCPPFLPRQLKRSMSIHDVSFLSHPEWFPRLYQLSCQVYSRFPAPKTNIIFTISDFSAKEIQHHYDLPLSHILVTPLAAHHTFTSAAATAPAIPGLGQRYFLFVGKMFNRRHVRQMLLAFRDYLAANHDTVTQFVLRGQDETHPAEHLQELVREINLVAKRQAIIWPEYCTDQQLLGLYQSAVGFFYLSTYEGFGLPVLEALACGTPTVTVRASSIPEVAGEAGIYVDPKNVNEIAQVMARLISDTAWVSERRKLALAQAQKFSWHHTARATLLAIEKAYGA